MLAVNNMASNGVCECRAFVEVVGGGNSVVRANVGNTAVVNVSNVQIVGVNPSDATAIESDVLEGKSFYSGNNSLRVGTLNENIHIMQAIDLQNINYIGGYEMASDEEYRQADQIFLYWGKIIMGVVENV